MTENQAAYHRKRSLCRMAAMLTNLGAPVQLLSLHYGTAVPRAIADRQYRTLMDQARRLVGGPFRYVKVTEYSESPLSSPMIYRLFLDLPAELCQEIAGYWFMGNTAVEQVNTQRLMGFTANLMAQTGKRREVGCRLWTTSLGLGLAQQARQNSQAS